MKAQGPVKLLEFKSEDWLKGMSRQTTAAVGGVFKTATAYDPFEQPGVCLPCTSPTAVSGASNSVLFLTPFVASGVPYLFGHANAKLYKINALTAASTDETASINVAAGSIGGATVWRDRYIYSPGTTVRSVTLALASDTEILTGLTSSVPHVMTTGADKNCYITNGSDIAKLILESGTTGNSTNVFSLETGQVAKDLTSDGRYLVIVSDNNAASATTVRSKCLITFWDMARGTADAIHSVEDSFLLGVRLINGVLYVIGYDNIYICTAGSPPQVVYSFLDAASVTGRPPGPAAIAVRRGCLLWAQSDGSLIYALGNPLDPTKPVLYTPYTNSTGNGQTLAVTGTKVWSSTSTPAVNLLTGSTRTTASLVTVPLDFGANYELNYCKVVTKGILASGESLDVQITTKAGNGVLTTSATKNFSSDPNKQTFIFYPSAATVSSFEELDSIQLTVGKQPWLRFELWATPILNEYTS